MSKTPRLEHAHVRISDLRGLHRLASDGTLGVIDLVEAMHHAILRTAGPLGKAPAGRTGGLTGFVYRSVRGITRAVGGGVDVVLAAFGALIDEVRTSPEREALLAALNGVLGDHLAATRNPLAIRMSLRANGAALELSRSALAEQLPRAGGHPVVLVHGLCMNDRQWSRQGHDHGARLEADLGCTPVYLHYNTGRHVSENGRELAGLMNEVLRAWPQPVLQLTMIGHSMGGLVLRSACHYAGIAGHAWVTRLDRLVFLGTPHLGVPLERAGRGVDFALGISPYTAPFARRGNVRSAGVKDLGHGYLRDEDWQGHGARSATRASSPLPRGVRCYAMAAIRGASPGTAASRLAGDGLVPVDRALGLSIDPARDLGLPVSRRWIGGRMGHFDLLDDAKAYAKIRAWVSAPGDEKRRTTRRD